MIKRFIRNLKRKRNQNGESMAEVLVAALIIELALIAAVSMIISAGRIIVKSKDHYDQYFVRQNARASGAASEVGDITITISSEGMEPMTTTITASLKEVQNEDGSKITYYYEPK